MIKGFVLISVLAVAISFQGCVLPAATEPEVARQTAEVRGDGLNTCVISYDEYHQLVVETAMGAEGIHTQVSCGEGKFLYQIPMDHPLLLEFYNNPTCGDWKAAAEMYVDQALFERSYFTATDLDKKRFIEEIDFMLGVPGLTEKALRTPEGASLMLCTDSIRGLLLTENTCMNTLTPHHAAYTDLRPDYELTRALLKCGYNTPYIAEKPEDFLYSSLNGAQTCTEASMAYAQAAYDKLKADGYFDMTEEEQVEYTQVVADGALMTDVPEKLEGSTLSAVMIACYYANHK